MQSHGGQQSLVERYTQTQPLSSEQLRARLQHLQGVLATLYQSPSQQGVHPVSLGCSAPFPAPVAPAVWHMGSQHVLHGPATHKARSQPPLLPPLSARRSPVLPRLTAQGAAVLPPLSARTRPPSSAAMPGQTAQPTAEPQRTGLQAAQHQEPGSALVSPLPEPRPGVPKPIFNLLRAAMKPKLPSPSKPNPLPGSGINQQATKALHKAGSTPTILQPATAVRSRAVTPPPAGSLPTPSSAPDTLETQRFASGPAGPGANTTPAAGDTLQLLADMAEMLSPLPQPHKDQQHASSKHAEFPAAEGAAQMDGAGSAEDAGALAKPAASSAGLNPATDTAGAMELDNDSAAGRRKRARDSTAEAAADQKAAASAAGTVVGDDNQTEQGDVPSRKRGRPSKAEIAAREAAAQKLSAETKKQKWARPVKGYTRKQEVKDLLNKTIEIPGPVFGVDVPDLYYRARVVGPDKQHAQAVVIRMADDKAKYFFPIGQAREWLQETEARRATQPPSVSPHTTSDRSDAFAAEVLAQLSNSRTTSANTQGAAALDSSPMAMEGQDGHTSKRQWQSS